ncbi:MAG TPA: helix-turn-helix transcriptional regulator [Terriglobales bacterium]|nr:helix-turn-helix transcriptional regulator [Terriglobales bacterium]
MENGMRGDRLKALRESRDLTQSELAIELEISEPQIWRYENGESKPRGDVVVKLATFFGVSADYLFGLTDDPGMHVEGDLSQDERAAHSCLETRTTFRGDKDNHRALIQTPLARGAALF